MDGIRTFIRPDMAQAIAQEIAREHLPDIVAALPRRMPEGLKLALIGASGGLAIGALLGLGLAGVI